MHRLQDIEQQLGKQNPPSVRVGDTVEVHYLIKEGDKERVQLFIGTVIAQGGRGIRRTVTVRRIVQGEGVERVFPLHNPRVKDIVAVRHGETRRAKLFFLRDRVGKKTRLREVFSDKEENGGSDGAESSPDGADQVTPPMGGKKATEPAGAR